MSVYKDNLKRQRFRDLRLMRYLSAGPVSKKTLHELFFKNEQGKLLSRQIFERRLKQLGKQDRIKALHYHGEHGEKLTYYVLTDFGAAEVSSTYMISRESIRTVKPPKHRLRHELKVAEIIRTIEREVQEKKYQVGYLYDDSVMRQVQGTGKNTYYADLCLLLIRNRADAVPYPTFIEYDGGTKSESYWIKKIEKWDGVAIILSDEIPRLQRFVNYVKNSEREQHTLLALHGEFVKNGFSGTRFYFVKGDFTQKLNLE